MYIRKTLDNGLRVICEKLPYVKSVSVGVWAGAGSRLETLDTCGISHFAEHMLFKGTAKRSAQEIAQEMDFIGGHLNAFTSRECTCYYAKVIDRHLETAIDILSDMYTGSLFSKADIELERQVIIEEINMYEDSPEDISLDLLAKAAWGNDSLGFLVSGTHKSVSSIDKAALEAFAAKYYTAANTVISVVGNFDEDNLFALLESCFAALPRGTVSYADYDKAEFLGGTEYREKDIEQTHIAFGFEGAASGSEMIYSEAVLSNVLGGAMSSRLFQKVREERGLAYSIYTAPESYSKAGLLYIYAGLSDKNTDAVRQIIWDEIASLIKDGVSPYELQKGKQQLSGSYILSLESVGGRMNALGKCEVLGENIKTPDEVLQGIDRVDNDAVNNAIKRIFNGKCAQSIVASKKN